MTSLCYEDLKLQSNTVAGQASGVEASAEELKDTSPEAWVPVGAPVKEASPSQRRTWSSLLKDSSSLEEIGTPTQHVSGVPFVLILDENIEAAKEEFEDFVFTQFHGPAPAMGRVIGVVNAI